MGFPTDSFGEFVGWIILTFFIMLVISVFSIDIIPFVIIFILSDIYRILFLIIIFLVIIGYLYYDHKKSKEKLKNHLATIEIDSNGLKICPNCGVKVHRNNRKCHYCKHKFY